MLRSPMPLDFSPWIPHNDALVCDQRMGGYWNTARSVFSTILSAMVALALRLTERTENFVYVSSGLHRNAPGTSYLRYYTSDQ